MQVITKGEKKTEKILLEKDLNKSNNNNNNFKLASINNLQSTKTASKEKEEFIRGLDEKVSYWSTMKAAKKRQKNLSFNEYQKIKDEQRVNTFGNITQGKTITLGDDSMPRESFSTIDIMSPNFLADFFNKFTTNLGKENV